MKKHKNPSLADAFPELAAQWHPYKNGPLTPQEVTTGSIKRVWWYLPYDDELTGHHDFEWQSRIADRIKCGGCPFLTGRAIWKGFNDLQTRDPEIAAMWHPLKNKGLFPDEVTTQSGRKVWWLLIVKDERGEHILEWEERIADLVLRRACPYITSANVKVCKGFNDLNTLRPDLAKQWHPYKNGNLTPEDVTIKSNKKVWWMATYTNPFSGEPLTLEWMATVADRTAGNNNLFISRLFHTSFPEQAFFYYIKQVFPDAINGYKKIFDNNMELDIFIPELSLGLEYDGRNWHKDSNRIRPDMEKYAICKENGITLVRVSELKRKDFSKICDNHLMRTNPRTKRNLDKTIKEFFDFLLTLSIDEETKRIIQFVNINTEKDECIIKAQYLYKVS